MEWCVIVANWQLCHYYFSIDYLDKSALLSLSEMNIKTI